MSDTTTRSGMLWEVEQILTECKEKPQILLMENVPQIHSQDNLEDFNKWQYSLEKMGYSNYWQDLIATDFGIPQTRNRCFMISIIGDYNYTFPKPIPLKLKLKDLLEDKVYDKYYLSDKMINYLTNENTKGYQRKQAFESVQKNIVENGIAGTITTNAGNRATDNFIVNKHLKETLEKNKIEDTCYIDTYNKRINKDKSGTITTGVSFRNNTFLADTHLKIRKLTPRECFRLMGVKDEDFEKIRKNQSDSSLYHLAGDSIVVNVLMAIFKELL